MDYQNILTIVDNLNGFYENKINFEVLFRKNEPSVILKTYKPSTAVMVTIYMKSLIANAITDSRIMELVNFLIEQEEYRRQVVRENVLQVESD